jgi:poly(3-hydroxybutyrate) depolymerase
VRLRGRALAVGVAVVLGLGSWALAGCGSSGSSKDLLRPVSALPLTQTPVDSGRYVTRMVQMPKGYGSAGRTFILHSPRTSGPVRPLVILLHGLYQTPAMVEQATAATSFSNDHDFTLVYPFGRSQAWNAGTCCRRDTANDVGFMVDLVHYVSELTPVDLHRVYIWGFSNGGMMAWRAVCQTRNVFAGAGVVAGALLVGCPVPVHVVELHGTADKTVPFLGGYSHYTHTDFPDSAKERSKLMPGSTLQRMMIKDLGHRWPSPRYGAVDPLDVLWNGLSHFQVAHPAVSAPV